MMGLLSIALKAILTPKIICAFCPASVVFPVSRIHNGCRYTKNEIFASMEDTSEISSSSTDVERVVEELLGRVEKKDGDDEGVFDEDAVRGLMATLSSNADQYVLDETPLSSSKLFEPLVGYYNVSCTLTEKPNDNPVGGKWTRGLWTVKRTMQHVLPPLPAVQTSIPSATGTSDLETSEVDFVTENAVAQVVNAIRLELLWGFVNIWVLLRGDAVPLKMVKAFAANDNTETNSDSDSKSKKSPPKLLPNLSDRAVKAYFDRPKIGVSLQGRKKRSYGPFWKQVLTLGPTSAVVLDTPYADGRIRLGKGGTSGSQFVFRRLPETDEDAKEGWKWVLETTSTDATSLTKKKLVLRAGILGIVFSIFSRLLHQRWIKIGAGVSALISGISMIGLMRSTGGIETEGDTYMKGKD